MYYEYVLNLIFDRSLSADKILGNLHQLETSLESIKKNQTNMDKKIEKMMKKMKVIEKQNNLLLLHKEIHESKIVESLSLSGNDNYFLYFNPILV